MTVVIGADLSFSNTGLVLAVEGKVRYFTEIKSKGRKGATYAEWLERIEYMSFEVGSQLDEWCNEYVVDLGVIEAPSHGSKFGNPHERAGFWWKVYEAMVVHQGLEVATLAPTSLKKYVTDNGRADKAEVLTAARERWCEDIPSHDVADATGLAMWGTERFDAWDDGLSDE